MGVLLRYAFLMALGMVSIFALVNATAVGGQMFLAEAGHTVENPSNLTFWVVGAMAALSLLSLFRTVVMSPSRFRLWMHYNQGRFYTLLLGGLLCAVFFLI